LPKVILVKQYLAIGIIKYLKVNAVQYKPDQHDIGILKALKYPKNITNIFKSIGLLYHSTEKFKIHDGIINAYLGIFELFEAIIIIIIS